MIRRNDEVSVLRPLLDSRMNPAEMSIEILGTLPIDALDSLRHFVTQFSMLCVHFEYQFLPSR